MMLYRKARVALSLAAFLLIHFLASSVWCGNDAAVAAEPLPESLIGYTEGRNDLEGGQFVNWRTNRACVVRSDATGRKVLAEELTRTENSWTQFAGWSPDGRQAIVLSLWESPENAAWEREHRTFRMTEGWLVDACLLELQSGTVTNLTAIDRVSIYNTGLFFLPDSRHLFYAAKVDDSIELMRVDLDSNVTRLTTSRPGTRHYHPSVSSDGKWILFGSDRSGIMQLYVATIDGKEMRPITHVPAGHSAMHGHWQPARETPIP